MQRANRVQTTLARSLACLLLAFALSANAARESRSVNMSGEWTINDELTQEIRKTLPAPKQGPGFFENFRKSVDLSVGIPGVPVSAPVPGMGSDGGSETSEATPLHSYGRVVAIEIRDWPPKFGVDYGKGRGWMLTPDEETVETIKKRDITTKSGWRGDRYTVRKSADDGSKMSETFELINDGQQLKWTVVERRKGQPEITEIAIYDKVEPTAEE
jgi:hypothetical protein